jgi:hypothetical protein
VMWLGGEGRRDGGVLGQDMRAGRAREGKRDVWVHRTVMGCS